MRSHATRRDLEKGPAPVSYANVRQASVEATPNGLDLHESAPEMSSEEKRRRIPGAGKLRESGMEANSGDDDEECSKQEETDDSSTANSSGANPSTAGSSSVESSLASSSPADPSPSSLVEKPDSCGVVLLGLPHMARAGRLGFVKRCIDRGADVTGVTQDRGLHSKKDRGFRSKDVSKVGM